MKSDVETNHDVRAAAGSIRRWLAAGLLAALSAFAPLGAVAADDGLNRIDDWAEATGWEGVGLLIMGGRASCTGALIRPDLVLTAAHCLYDTEGHTRFEPAEIEFRASWRDGQALAHRAGRRALMHPDYLPGQGAYAENIFNDIGLLQLDSPVLSGQARPFSLGTRLKEGLEVSVVSYGAGRNDAASIQRACHVVADYKGVGAMDCDVVPGSSGSPVFALGQGDPRIVSVISALGVDNGQQLAFGMDLSAHIRTLLAAFDAGNGVYPSTVGSAKRVSPGSGGGKRSETGAHFVRP